MSQPVDLSQLLQAFGLGRRQASPNGNDNQTTSSNEHAGAVLHVPGFIVHFGALRFFVPTALIQHILAQNAGTSFDSVRDPFDFFHNFMVPSTFRDPR
jgi:hypothetical protein